MIDVTKYSDFFFICWVLVKVPRTKTHKAAEHVPMWWIGRALLIGGWGGVLYNMESLTVDHSGKHVWRTPRSLHITDLLCRFLKKNRHVVADIKD